MALTINQIISHVSDYAERDINQDVAQRFVREVESVLNWGSMRYGMECPPVRVRQQHKKATLELEDGAASLPDDFATLDAIARDGYAQPRLEYLPLDEFTKRNEDTLGLSEDIFTIIGNQIIFGSGQTNEVFLLYYAELEPFVDGQNTPNIIVADHPDIYEVGVLERVYYRYRNAEEAAGRWEQFCGAIKTINETRGVAAVRRGVRARVGFPPLGRNAVRGGWWI